MSFCEFTILVFIQSSTNFVMARRSFESWTEKYVWIRSSYVYIKVVQESAMVQARISLTEGNSSWNVTHSDTIWQSTRVSKICKNLKTIGVLTGDFSISVVRMIKNSFLISALITPSRPRINSRHRINISLAPKKREDNKRNYVGQTIDKWSLYSSHVAHSAEAYPSFSNPLTP